MNREEYLAKLRDPRWQKMRLEVMQRDEFRCFHCASTDKTLNVHHCYYEWDRDPWDYPISSLRTLCEECHEFETDFVKRQKKALFDVLGKHGFTSAQFRAMAMMLDRQLSKAQSQNEAISVAMTVFRGDEHWDWQYELVRAFRDYPTQEPPAEQDAKE
jgi:hypothetical protein